MDLTLLPQPRSLTLTGGDYELAADRRIVLQSNPFPYTQGFVAGEHLDHGGGLPGDTRAARRVRPVCRPRRNDDSGFGTVGSARGARAGGEKPRAERTALRPAVWPAVPRRRPPRAGPRPRG